MSIYNGWAVLSGNKFLNDNTGAVGPALFATRREAYAWSNDRKIKAVGGKVVKVLVDVSEAK